MGERGGHGAKGNEAQEPIGFGVVVSIMVAGCVMPADVVAAVASIASTRHEILAAWDVGEAVVLEMTVHYRRHDGSELALASTNG